MKKILFHLLLFISFFIWFNNLYADFTSDIKYYNWLINLKNSDIQILQSKMDNLEVEYKNLINDVEKNIYIEQQQSAVKFASLWLTFSSWAENASIEIEKKWKKMMEDLQTELDYNLSVYKRDINYLLFDIDNYKSKITDLENQKSEQDKIDNVNKAINFYEDRFSNNFELWTTNYNKWNYNNAIKYFKIACEELPDYWDVYSCFFNIGLSYKNIKNYSDSKFYFLKAIESTNDLEKIQEANDMLKLIDDNIKINSDKQKQKTELIFNQIKKQLNRKSQTQKNNYYQSLLKQLNPVKDKLTWDKSIIINHLIYLLNQEINK